MVKTANERTSQGVGGRLIGLDSYKDSSESERSLSNTPPITRVKGRLKNLGKLLRGRSFLISRETAVSFRPILKWVKEAAPRQRERTQAANILKQLEGIRDWKQVILTRGEAELLGFIRSEFPEGVSTVEGKQLDLFTISPFGPAQHELPTPPPWIGRRREPKPTLKETLTAEEQAERDSTVESGGYQVKPDSHWDRELRLRGGKEE